MGHGVAFTGAGVSTESGIPDFRSPGGVWTKYDPEEFAFPRFVSSVDARRKYWRWGLEFYPHLVAARRLACRRARNVHRRRRTPVRPAPVKDPS